MSNISSVIKSIQDVMRQDSGVDGDAQRISQLTWLLFLKVFDALEEELELTRDHYTSPIPQTMRWRSRSCSSAQSASCWSPEIVPSRASTALLRSTSPKASRVTA